MIELTLSVEEGAPVAAVRRAAEGAYLEALLEQNGWNRKRTARVLGVRPLEVRRHIRRLALAPPRPMRTLTGHDAARPGLARWRFG
mgnify:CR=1 FL=1